MHNTHKNLHALTSLCNVNANNVDDSIVWVENARVCLAVHVLFSLLVAPVCIWYTGIVPKIFHERKNVLIHACERTSSWVSSAKHQVALKKVCVQEENVFSLYAEQISKSKTATFYTEVSAKWYENSQREQQKSCMHVIIFTVRNFRLWNSHRTKFWLPVRYLLLEPTTLLLMKLVYVFCIYVMLRWW